MLAIRAYRQKKRKQIILLRVLRALRGYSLVPIFSLTRKCRYSSLLIISGHNGTLYVFLPLLKRKMVNVFQERLELLSITGT